MRCAELLAGLAAAGLLVAGLSQPAHALSLLPPAIRSGLAMADEKVFFCQGDSLTVLDLATGRVLVRDFAARCDGWLRATPWGVLEMRQHGYRMIDPAATVTRGALTSAWSHSCVYPRPLGDDDFLCPRTELGDESARVERRSLQDGRLLWSVATPKLVLDTIERDGRLLLQSGTDRRAEHLSVIEQSTGRLVLQADVPAADSMSVRSFDGTTVELESAQNLPAGCSGRRVRRLTWTAAGSPATSDDCGPVPPQPSRQRDREQAGPITLSFSASERNGERIEASGPLGRWRALTRRSTARRQREYQAPGAVLLESADRGARVVWLECLDGATGRPRWMYGFPFYRSWPRDPSPHPRGTVPIEEGAAALPLDTPYPAPVVRDPAPLPPTDFDSFGTRR